MGDRGAGICQSVQTGSTHGGRPIGAAAASQERVVNRAMASDKVVTFTDGTFDSDVLKAAKPVLVDFWAEWCGPCRAMGPAIDALAADNVDENPTTTIKYQIRGIPAVMLFKDGKIVEQQVGLCDKKSLQQMVDKHL